MFMQAVDWTGIHKKYKGLWVGLKDDEETVVASGKSIDEVMKKAEEKGYPKPILYKVPAKLTYFVGSIK